MDNLAVFLPLGPDIDCIEGLLFLEGRAVSSAKTIAVARTEFAYSVYMILEHELWKYHKSPDGEPLFQTQNEYLYHLSGQCMAGISTMKGYRSAMLLANALGYSYEDVMQRGIYIFNEFNKGVVTDRRTGEPKALRSGIEPPGNLKDYLRESIDELSFDPARPDIILRPAELRQGLQEKLSPGSANIWFEQRPSSLKWFYQKTRADGTLIFLDGEVHVTSSPPQAVKAEVNKRLRAKEIDYE